MTEERAEYTVHPDVLVRLETSEKHIKQLTSTIDGITMVMGRHADTITAQRERIAELEATVLRQMETIARLERTIDGYAMIQGRHADTITEQAKRIEKIAEEKARAIAQLEYASARIANLEAQIAAMPLDALRRYHLFTHYDVHAANDVGYTTQQFDSDDEDIRLWLTSLDGDA